MSNHSECDAISPPETSNGSVIRVERVWQHRHNLELMTPKLRRKRASFVALGAGGLLLGAVCAFAYNDLPPAHNLVSKDVVTSYPVEQKIMAASTKLRDIVDAAPPSISETRAPALPLPYAAIPTKRPFYAHVASRKPDRSTSSTTSSDVVRFDRCDPSCETRDPLVIGTAPAPAPITVHAEAAELDSRDHAMKIGVSALNGASFVLTQTAALPFTTLRLSRDALLKVSGLD